jgi:hypothetical protein
MSVDQSKDGLRIRESIRSIDLTFTAPEVFCSDQQVVQISQGFQIAGNVHETAVIGAVMLQRGLVYGRRFYVGCILPTGSLHDTRRLILLVPFSVDEKAFAFAESWEPFKLKRGASSIIRRQHSD